MSGPIRLFIGCSAGDDQESCAVVEYTARKHCSMDLDITWMHQAKTGFWSGWRVKNWRTPFTGYRWGIPAACGWEGRAIYMDSDFIVRGDLAELWNDKALDGKAMLAKLRGDKVAFCCLLFDNAKMGKCGIAGELSRVKQDEDQQGTMKNFFIVNRHLVGEFSSGDWNAADLHGYPDINDPRIKAIHYSRVETQPHLEFAIARLAKVGRRHWYTGEVRRHGREDLVALFKAELDAAKANGYALANYDFSGPIERRNFTYSKHKGDPLNAV